MATLTDSGRAALASSLLDEDLFVGLGAGLEIWDNPETFEAETRAVSDITNALCFIKINDKQFVKESETGSIILPQGRFEISHSPTPNLYLKAALNFTEMPTATIREVAVFKDTELAESVLPGQTFYTTADVTNNGQLIFIDRQTTPINRSAGRRETFEFVITL